MRPEPTREQIGATIQQHAERKGASLAALSRMLSRDSSYLARFVAGGPPARLVLRDRHLLAAFFAIDEWELGARPGEPRYVPRSVKRVAKRWR